MAQLPALTISGTVAADITAELAAGRYLAQVQGQSVASGVLLLAIAKV